MRFRALLAGGVALLLLAPVPGMAAVVPAEDCGTDSACADTANGVPSAPRNVVVNAADATSVTLGWAPPATSDAGPVTGYVVRWGALGVRTTTLPSIRIDGLTPRTQYVFVVHAVNRDGESPGVGIAARTRAEATPPSAPRDLTASDVGATSLTVDFRRPADDGGADVLGYLVTWGDQETYVTATRTTLTGLEPATRYRVAVRARNAVGVSDPVEVVATTLLDPIPTPTPPTTPRDLGIAESGRTYLDLRWAEPRSDGGAPITGYLLQWGHGERLAVEADARAARIDGLAAGTEYRIAVLARNAMGDSEPAVLRAYTAMDPVPAPQPPTAPQDPRVTWTTRTEIALAWTAPAEDGGLPIDAYEVTDETGTITSTTTPFVVMGGYQAGTSHTFAIRARNAVGPSPPVTVSAFTSIDPVPGPSVPSLPRALTSYSVAADAIALAWRPPADDGRSPIVGYQVSWGGATQLFVQRESTVLEGLDPGTGYEISVRAVNDSGAGAPAQVSVRTRLVPVPAPQAPSEPRRLRVVDVSRTSLLVDWIPLRTDGGSPVTAYRVQVSGAAPFLTTESAAMITGLVPGTEYRVSVAALNQLGSSPDAVLSAYTGMDPVPAPRAPTVPVDPQSPWTTTTTVALAWLPPADDGGSPVLDYQVSDDLGRVTTSDAPFVVMDGFAPATSHVFRIQARNAVGLSDPATVVATTILDPVPTPRAPGEPRALRMYSVSTHAVALAWRAPADAASRPVDGYQVTWGEGEQVFVAQPSVVVEDLQPGTGYTFRVRAVNFRGPGPQALIEVRTRLSPVPAPEAPDAPRDLRVTGVTSASIALQWSPPARDGGRAVTAYRVRVAGGAAFLVAQPTALVTGLSAERDYTIEVQALNDAGESPVTRIRARTAAEAPPGPQPVPGPQPAPISPSGPGSNADGSVDHDGRPETVRQTAPGRWGIRTWALDGRPVRIARASGLLTNAGQTATIRVTYRSPSIAATRIRLDRRTGWYVLTSRLKPGASSGSVILTVGAPQVTRDDVTYEPLQSSRRLVVLRSPRR